MAAVTCAQDMFYVMRLVHSMGLQVKLPMKLQVDNVALFLALQTTGVLGAEPDMSMLVFPSRVKGTGFIVDQMVA